MTITKQEFLLEIKLIGGRGYGMFIETDSRRHTVETGDKILEVCYPSLARNADVVYIMQHYYNSHSCNIHSCNIHSRIMFTYMHQFYVYTYQITLYIKSY